MQLNKEQCNTIQCNAVQFNTTGYNTIQCNTKQYILLYISIVELQQSRSRELRTWRSEVRSPSSVAQSVVQTTRVWVSRLRRDSHGSITDGGSRRTSRMASPSRRSSVVKDWPLANWPFSRPILQCPVITSANRRTMTSHRLSLMFSMVSEKSFLMSSVDWFALSLIHLFNQFIRLFIFPFTRSVIRCSMFPFSSVFLCLFLWRSFYRPNPFICLTIVA